jgi:hypothetical protein
MGTMGVALLVLGACGGGSGDPADAKVFCARLERLTGNDPFRAFGDHATAKEIQTAFTALVARAQELVDAAPAEVRPTARDYASAAKALDSLMAGAAYDGSAVDARAYRDAQTDYIAAANLLERYLDTDC